MILLLLVAGVAWSDTSRSDDPLTTCQFSAQAYDQFNALLTSQPAFTWSAQGLSINASGLATADGDAGASYTVLAKVGSIFGSAILQINSVPTPPAPVITPAGGTISQPQTVTFSGAVLTPLTVTPGWRTGVKYPNNDYESVAAMSYDGGTVAALRGRTSARSRWMFPGASMSPDSGLFPFYIWSLADLSGWVTYTGTNGSGRVTAPVGATRFWLTLAGGDPVGSREMVISDKPKTTTRFTCNGAPVTPSSPIVTNALTVTRDVTIRARAYSAADGQSAETVAAFTSNIPLLPSESYVSPAYIAIAHATLDGSPAQVSLNGPSGLLTGLALGDFRYLFRYPLLPDAPTPLTLRRNGLPDLTGNVRWRALEIGTSPDTQIHLGDTVILSASNTTPGELIIQVYDATGAVVAVHSTLNPEPCTLPLLPDRAGTYTAVALLNGVSIGALVITVTQVELQGPIACQIGFRREKEVLIYGPAGSVTFTANDPTLLEVSVKETTPCGVRLYLKALKAGTPILQARLGSPTGPILAQQEVDEFALKTQADKVIYVVETFADGSKLLQTNLEMMPHVLDLAVRMHIIIRGVTFEDSTLDKELNTNEFTYHAASDKWLCPYRLIASPDIHTGSCHDIAIYQGSDQVGK